MADTHPSMTSNPDIPSKHDGHEQPAKSQASVGSNTLPSVDQTTSRHQASRRPISSSTTAPSKTSPTSEPKLTDRPSPSKTLSLNPIFQRFNLQTNMIGAAIAVGILPVLIVGVSTYGIAYMPQIPALLGIEANTITPQQLALWTLSTAIVAAIVVGSLGAYWVRRTLRPLLDSMLVIRAISQGHLAARVPIHGDDELAQIGVSINQMADQLQALLLEQGQQTQRLQEMTGALEGRVKQRTGQLSGVINQLKQEIWERKQAEKALQQSQVKLIHSEKMSGLGQMVAGIAHEINNPINFIHGNLKHIQTHVQEILSVLELYQTVYPDTPKEIEAIAEEVDIEFLSTDLRKIVSSMQLGTDRILDIVRSLRTFSRMDQVEFKPMDIHAGLESTLLILKHRFKGRPGRPQILTIKQYDDDLPLVDCQAGQINQVFMNILANALDVLDEAGDLCSQKSEPPMIVIATQRLNKDYIGIQLSDNGPGIPKKVQNRLFDPFFTTKPVGKGTGLGMSISYTIITENHGGRLKLISTEGQGASFLIELPIKQKQH